jgi:hypothetical protein
MIKAIKKTLSEFENATEPFDEYSVSEAIRKLRDKDDKSEPPMDWLAEYMAFGFYEDSSEQGSVWGTYFGPMMSARNQDGTVSEFPSIKRVTPEMLNYWSERAKQAKHPILKTRYAALVWEFSKHVTKKSADITMAHICIDNIIEMAKSLCHENECDVIQRMEYAVNLAISINDKTRLNKLRDAIIDFEDKVADDSKRGLWGFSFDTLLMNKKVQLSDGQTTKVVNTLEERLERVSDFDNKKSFDPFASESAATRLAQYYRRQNQPDDVKRVLLKYGNAFERASEGASSLLAIAWLQKVESVYRDFGLKDEADRILNVIRQRGPDVRKDMKPITVETEISREKMENYVNAMIDGELNAAMTRIAVHYIPKKDEAAQQLKDLAKEHPISFLFPTTIQDHNGRTIAHIGSLDKDLDGHVMRSITQDMQFSSIFLRNVLHKFREKFSVSSDSIVAELSKSPVFTKEKADIIKRGLDAYFDGDHLVAIHLLIPQIESAIRKLLELTGGTTYKQGRSGGYFLKTFDEMLRDERIVLFMGEDVTFYLRILYTDPRGWNLRNDVCHGISLPKQFCVQVTDRIFHTLLLLGQVRERKNQEENQ